MSKTYKRISDGFEVQDANDRPIEWAVETYDGKEGKLADWVEVIPPPPPTEEELAKAKEIAEKKDALAKSDYKILKKLEKLLPADDVDVLERQGKRDRINALETMEAV